MPEQEKPLEPVWFWARPAASWRSSEHWRPVRLIRGMVHDYQYIPFPEEDWEIGPRLHPPQEDEG